jgi:hypothetical protein
VRTEAGAAAKDPDRQVQERVGYVFRLFARHKVARQVVARLVREKLQIPAKLWGGPRHGQVTWKDPDLGDVMRLLRNAGVRRGLRLRAQGVRLVRPFADNREVQIPPAPP